MGKLATFRSDEYVGLGLTLIECVKASAGACLELWGVSGMIQIYWE